MTKLGNCWFTPRAIESDDPGEFAAPIEFTIELAEVPEVMLLNESETGYYLGQIKWRITSYGNIENAPFEIEVDIHGDVNPTYNAALISLFGEEVGATIIMRSEAFLSARKEMDYTEATYVSDWGIVDKIVSALKGEHMAKQVFGRLMTSSVFV